MKNRFFFTKQNKKKNNNNSFPISRWLSRDYFDGKTKIILSTKNLSNDNTMDLLENRTNGKIQIIFHSISKISFEFSYSI